MPYAAKRGVKLVLKSLSILVAVLLLLGTVYEQIGRWRDRRRFPQVGRSVDIGGRTLNLYCTGQGAPTVILEMSPHTAGYGWMQVQTGIAQFTRACWYDRAGYGWSDPAPLIPRTGTRIANDLHSLLQEAEIPPPYVLVAEAASGLQVRVYASLYPADVTGMVLIDATHPDQFAYEPEFAKGPAARIPRPIQRFGCALTPVMGRIGLIRLFARYPRLRPGPPPKGMRADEWLRLEMLSYQPTALAAAAGCALEENVARVRAAGDLGDRSLIVLTSPKQFDYADPAKAREAAEFFKIWVHRLQPQLAHLSTRGRQVVVPDASFGIPSEEPQVVVRAVGDVVAEVRATRH